MEADDRVELSSILGYEPCQDTDLDHPRQIFNNMFYNWSRWQESNLLTYVPKTYESVIVLHLDDVYNKIETRSTAESYRHLFPAAEVDSNH